MEAQLDRIKQKLAYLQQEGWENYQDDFGFDSHHLVMSPPLPFEKLLKFEQTYQLKLPEGYRRFLLEIGNGGAGPYNGILPLEHWYHAFSPHWVENDRFDKLGHLSGECEAHPNPDKDYGVNESYDLSDWDRGTITLCDQGCMYYSLLIVRGKEQGRVCYKSEMSEPYYMPDPDFLSWYERWQDETLTLQTEGWFGGAGWMMEEDKGPPNWQPLDLEEFIKNKPLDESPPRNFRKPPSDSEDIPDFPF